jgi:hypothetical protein
VKPRPWDSTHPQNIFGKSLEERVSRLEKQSEDLLAFLKLRFPKAYEGFLVQRYAPQTKKAKRGPKPQPSDDELLVRRYKLIWFLEQHWPELLKVLTKRNNEASIRARLESFTDSRFGPHVHHARYLIDRLPFLVDFIRSRDYTGDPRQIANALAGVPENAWPTSLKKCRAVPPQEAIGVRALRDYLRRNFPSVHAKLLNAQTVEAVMEAMATTPTTDREFLWMRHNPEFALFVLKQGIPR